MKRLLAGMAPALAVVLALGGQVFAGEVKVQGEMDYDPSTVTALKLKNGGTIQWQHFAGPFIDQTESDLSPLKASKATQHCLATLMFNEKNVLIGGHGVCDAIDADGDTWWLSFAAGGENISAWKVGGGTGKYEGMTGAGTTRIADWDVKTGKTHQTFEGVMTTK